MELEYDTQGRMKFNKDLHFAHGKPFKRWELIYMCKFYASDGKRSLSYALGRTEMTISGKVSNLKKEGLYDYYKSLDVDFEEDDKNDTPV